MSMRMTGLISGMDTESMVKELVKASSTKVNKVKQNKQKAEWKKEAWSSLNTKIYDFYKTQVAAFKTASSYKSKKAEVSDGAKIAVSAGTGVSEGVHTVSVKQVASSAYMTGASLKGATDVNGNAITGSTKLSDMDIALGTSFSVKGKEYVVDENSTIDDLVSAFNSAGVKASFDAGQGRFYINSAGTGEENDFEITATDAEALDKLGLGASATKIDAKNAIIEYNGVEYENSENKFSINGLTITAKEVSESPVNITISTDTDAAYNTVKEFVKAYNSLVEEMTKEYYAKKSTYDPLTEDERAQLSDSQADQWEKKAKEGLLSRDSTLNDLLSNMRSILNQGVEILQEDGTTKRMSLASLGIVTGDYTENGKLHIMGDADDPLYSSQENKLKAALTSNPDMVAEILGGTSTVDGIGRKLSDYMTDAMKRVEGSSSSLTFYNDKTMDKEISDYDDEIDKWQEKLTALEDKYYKQFGAMESAMAKMQQQQNYLASLMGGM